MGVGIGDAVRSKDHKLGGTVQSIKGEFAIVLRSDSGTLCAVKCKDLMLDDGASDRVTAYWWGQRVYVPGHREPGRVEDPTHSEVLGGPQDVVVMLDSGQRVAVTTNQLYPLHDTKRG